MRKTSYWSQLAIMLIMNAALIGVCVLIALAIMWFNGEF